MVFFFFLGGGFGFGIPGETRLVGRRLSDTFTTGTLNLDCVNIFHGQYNYKDESNHTSVIPR